MRKVEQITLCKVTQLCPEMICRIFKYSNNAQLKKIMIISHQLKNLLLNNFELWTYLHKKEFGKTEIGNKPIQSLLKDLRLSILQRHYFFSSKFIDKLEINLNQPDITQIKIHNEKIFVASDDKKIRVFSNNGLELVLQKHIGGVWTFDVTSKYIVSGSTDKTAIIWDRFTGRPLHVLCEHRSTIRCLRATPTHIITGSRDSSIKVWDYSGNMLKTLQGHFLSVRALDIYKDYLVSGSYDGSVRLWNFNSGKCIANLEKHLSRVYSVAINDKYVASGAQDSYIHISDHFGKLLRSLKGHRSIVAFLRFVKEGEKDFLFSSGADGQINKWCLKTGDRIYKIVEKNHITGLKIHNGVILVAKNIGVNMYSSLTGTLKSTILSHTDSVYDIEISSNKIAIGYKKENHVKLLIFNYPN